MIGYYRGPRLMSSLRRRWVLLRHPHANVQIHPTAYLGPGFSLHVPGPGTFVVGPAVEFRRGFRCEIEGTGRVTIGAQTRFTYYVLMQCSTTIEIGERCMFGQSTIVIDGNHRFRDITKPMLDQGYDYSPIRIEDDATITSKCTIIATIGKRAFIGANSVVTKPVPAYTVTVGAPARPIEYFGPPGEEPAELRPAAQR
jgi:acetyltransferase-like isoleucine patch superfamily enzyme